MNILYIMSVYNVFGGTPKKTLELIKNTENKSYLYIYEKGYEEFKYLFEEAGANITEGYFGRNLFKHIKSLLEVVDHNNIQIVQTQFSMGEVLGVLIKILRPKVKLIVTFESALDPGFFKKQILNSLYKKVDAFVFISNYVQENKTKQYPILLKSYSKVIYNGTEVRKITEEDCPVIRPTSLLVVAELIKLKNIATLIDAINFIVNNMKLNDINLYIVGDGPLRDVLFNKIKSYDLSKNVFILGHQKNIGGLLAACDIFVHPSYAEGFGIAVAEAMLAQKPIIVANAGALPELIENEKTGLVIEPFDVRAWVDAIIRLIKDKELSRKISLNAKKKAEVEFSIEIYVTNYKQLYIDLLTN